MIPFIQGQELRTLLLGSSKNEITIEFVSEDTSGWHFAIDAAARVQEVGFLLYPSLHFYTWEAEYLEWREELELDLQLSSDLTTEIPIFHNLTLNDGSREGGTHSVLVSMPPPEKMTRYTSVTLDMQLHCDGVWNRDCPIWDHIIFLHINCSDDKKLQMQEIGRWITPFRMRIGRWETDILSFTPLWQKETCEFIISIDAWWTPKPWVPEKYLPLFSGGVFNSSYNKKYQPKYFQVPSDCVKVELIAVISGHGYAEFINTTHNFTVNGQDSNVIRFDHAGTEFGCTRNVKSGALPNEHGTWLYGRDGWCDGEDVVPHVFDITAQISRSKVNFISYEGYPDAGWNFSASALMLLESHLSFYYTL
eukprot:TRINITY_DN3664_c0_g1_i1.p1 TRINITY_DN3664_c0_g1~~TRINITY_DN3664_c0_g1_i1.p1  ORF type:complete len:363 (+),score=40.22 TRINITY_DN3664_c0_g1_i1:510-1598(+)